MTEKKRGGIVDFHKYHCRRCHVQFETTALYPAAYRILCKKCEARERPGSAGVSEGHEERPVGYIQNGSSVAVLLFLGVACVLVMCFGVLMSDQQRMADANAVANAQKAALEQRVLRATLEKESHHWEPGSFVTVKTGGCICKTQEELASFCKAVANKDYDVMAALVTLGRAVRVKSPKKAILVRPGVFQCQVELDGFTGWIQTEMLQPHDEEPGKK